MLNKKKQKSLKKLLLPALLVFLAVVIYLLPGKSREDRMNAFLEDNRLKKIIVLALESNDLNDHENAIASSAVSRLEKEINRQSEEDKKESATDLGKILSVTNNESGGQITINDPFIGRIQKDSIYYAKSLLEKLENSTGIQNDITVSFYISELTEVNPAFYPEKTAAVILAYLNKHNPASLNQETLSHLQNLLHWLASRENTDFKFRFYLPHGNNINIRTGPGKENKLAYTLKHNDPVFIIDSESRQESIGGKTGTWKRIFDFTEMQPGWIFSPFLEKAEYSPEIAAGVEKKFSTTGIQDIDFNTWNPQSLPPGFSGRYKPLETIAVEGDTGIILNSGKDKLTEICRPVGNPAEISFRFSFLEGNEKIKLFTLANHGSETFQIEVDRDGIYLNKNKYILDTRGEKVLLNLSINQTTGKGSLINKGEVILGNITANSGISEQLMICLHDSGKNNDSKAVLYNFRIKPLK